VANVKALAREHYYDGLAVITMSQLGLDSSHFLSAITKLTQSHKGKLIRGEFYTSLDERIRFIREMVEVVKSRERVSGTISKLDGAKQ
jgi:hypothetical protein